MNDSTTRSILISISYLAALLLIILNFKPIMQGIGSFIEIFDPFLHGMIIAFILNIPCASIENLLQKRLLKGKSKALTRTISIVILYTLFAVLLVLIVSYLIPGLISSMQDLLKNIDVYANNLQSLVDKAASFFGLKNSIDMSAMFSWTAGYTDKMAKMITEFLGHIINLTAEGMSLIARFFFSIIFSVYFLAGKSKLLRQGKAFFSHYMPEKVYEKSSYLYHITIDTFSNYFVGQIVEALILSGLCFVGMLALGIEYPILISALIGITALVPMIGPYIGGLIAFRILVMINPINAILFIIFIIVLQQVEGYVIYPKVVGKRVGLPDIWVLLSIMVGSGLAGATGIIMGVPIGAVIYTLIKKDVNSKPLA